MTLVITLYVREGIVMASDSRMTVQVFTPGVTVIPNLVHTREQFFTRTDSVYKTYLVRERIGVSLYGAADIGGVPVSGFMESFVREHRRDTGTVESCARALLEEFHGRHKARFMGFHIAGYDSNGGQDTPVVYHLPAGNDELELVNPADAPPQGAIWAGEDDIMNRLLRKTKLAEPIDEEQVVELPHYATSYSWFTLQDAIDFAFYALRVTIDTMRFQLRANTVGGPIDLLVIRPDGPEWLQRKTLVAQR